METKTNTASNPASADVREFVDALGRVSARCTLADNGKRFVVGSASDDNYRETCERVAAEINRNVSNSVSILRHLCGARRMPAEAIKHLDSARFTIEHAMQHGNAPRACPPSPVVTP
ncbi:MAG: hypothetical protein PHI35_09260 [Victivallaceae bacterium]|nr:hypothetical protein [Victivallaceae bacterium]